MVTSERCDFNGLLYITQDLIDQQNNNNPVIQKYICDGINYYANA